MPERAGVVLREALGLWHGPALADLEFEPFAPAEISRLEEQRLVALEARVEADLARGSHAALVSELQRLRAEHPWRERLHAQLMLALYRSGRQAEALEVYRDARADPRRGRSASSRAPSSSSLHQRSWVKTRRSICRARTLPATRRRRTRSPVTPAATAQRAAGATEPHDRSRPRAAHDRRTAARGRGVLLTLTGPGGVGKTRLALEAARAVQADFADGAWFVSLAALERSRDVAGAIVSALNIVPVSGRVARGGGRTLLGRQAPAAGGGQLRAPAGGRAVHREIAGGRPGRHGAGHQSRAAWPFTPNRSFPCHRSRCPTRHRTATLMPCSASTPLRCSANARVRTTRLRAEPTTTPARWRRSAGGSTGCRWRSSSRPRAAPCSRRARSPLAWRWHSARWAAGHGTRPPASRRLQATLDWSHGLLDDDEQACFARMAVFAGGATVEAAETIAGADLDTLDRLVAKSLLVRRRGAARADAAGDARDRAGVRRRAFRGPGGLGSGARAPLRPLPERRSPPRDPIRRSTARTRASTWRAWTTSSRTSVPRCDSRTSATPPSGCSSSPPRSSTTGSGAIAPTRPWTGSSRRCASRPPPPIRRCEPARSARRSGRSGIPSARTSFRRCSRRPRR